MSRAEGGGCLHPLTGSTESGTQTFSHRNWALPATPVSGAAGSAAEPLGGLASSAGAGHPAEPAGLLAPERCGGKWVLEPLRRVVICYTAGGNLTLMKFPFPRVGKAGASSSRRPLPPSEQALDPSASKLPRALRCCKHRLGRAVRSCRPTGLLTGQPGLA